MLTNAAHRLRPLLIGLIVLIFSAGIVSAAKPSSPPGRPDASHGPAASAAPTKGPAASSSPTNGQNGVNEDENEAPDADTEATETEAADANDNCTTDPTGLIPEQLAELTHGQIVCWAAHQSTPPQYKNHGAWVSHWAKGSHGPH